MFYCENPKCKKLSKPNEPSRLIVVETRQKVYRNLKNEIVGSGVETARELRVCQPCAGEGAKND